MKGIVKKIVSVILTAALIVTAVNYVPGPKTVKAATQLHGGTCDKGTVESWELGSYTTGEKFSDTVDTLNNYVRFSGVSATVNKGDYAGSAIDNNAASRWENAPSEDGNYITVDLCHSYPIRRIFVCWETASASKYHIEVSNDGTRYTTVATLTNMPRAGGNANDSAKRARTDKVTLNNEVYARYVKIYVDSRTTYDNGTQYGSSIWEIGIYGSETKASETNSFTDTDTSKIIKQSGNTGVTFEDIVDYKYYNYVRNNAVTSTTSKQDDAAKTPIGGAIDNDAGTRWSYGGGDATNYTVDLGAVYSVEKVYLSWEQANSTVYNIYKSEDGTKYSLVTTVNTIGAYKPAEEGTLGARADKVSFAAVNARYIKIQAIQRCYKESNYKDQFNGMSLYEIGIYGTEQEKPYDMQAFPKFQAGSTQTIGNVLEAEKYATKAVGVEPETNGADSGDNIGGCDHGRWVQYNINFDRKTSKIYVRYAVKDNPGKIQIYLDDSSMSGTPVGELSVSTTGSWQSYTDASAKVEIPAGNHKVYFKFVSNQGAGAVCNLDYFQFEYKPENAEGKHEAEKAHAYVRGSAGKVANTSPSAGSYSGTAVGEMNTWYQHDRAYLTTYVKAAYSGYYKLTIQYAGTLTTLLQYRINDASTWRGDTTCNEQAISKVGSDWGNVNTVTMQVQLKKGINKIDISGAVWKFIDNTPHGRVDDDKYVDSEWLNIDYFTFEFIDGVKNAYADVLNTTLLGNKIEGEAFDGRDAKGDNDKDANAGVHKYDSYLGHTTKDSFATYNVYFDRDTTKMKFHASANSTNCDGYFEVWIDDTDRSGKPAATVLLKDIEVKDDWTQYKDVPVTLNTPIEFGNHVVMLYFVPSSKTYVGNIDYFQFEYTPEDVADSNDKHEAENAHAYTQGDAESEYNIQTSDNFSNGKAVGGMNAWPDNGRAYLTSYVNVKHPGTYKLTIAYASGSSKDTNIDYRINSISDTDWNSISAATTGGWTTVKTISAEVQLNRGINVIDVTGAANIPYSESDAWQQVNVDYFKLERITDANNLAFGKPVDATGQQTSSTEDRSPSNAVDEDEGTRWASDLAGDQAYLIVDLEDLYEIEKVNLVFERAYPRTFQILVSRDKKNWTVARTVRDFDKGDVDNVSYESSGVCLGKARYVKICCIKMAHHDAMSIRELKVYGTKLKAELSDLSLGKDVKVSSSDTAASTSEPKNAIDGKDDTRWAAPNSDSNPWYQIDLGKQCSIDTIDLKFERAYPKSFRIQISDDGESWTDYKTITDWTEPGTESASPSDEKYYDSITNDKYYANLELGNSIHMENVKTRYVRLYTDARIKSNWGLSIYEFEIWGKELDKTEYWQNIKSKTYGIYPVSKLQDTEVNGMIDSSLVQDDVISSGDTYEVVYEPGKELYFYVNPRDLYIDMNKDQIYWSAANSGTDLWGATNHDEGIVDYQTKQQATVKYVLPDNIDFGTSDYVTTEVACQIYEKSTAFDANGKFIEGSKPKFSLVFNIKVLKSHDILITDNIKTNGSLSVTNPEAGATYEWQRSSDGASWTNVSAKRYDLNILTGSAPGITNDIVHVAEDLGGGHYYRVRKVGSTEWSQPYKVQYYNDVQNGDFEYPAMFSTDEDGKIFPFNANGDEQQYPNGFENLIWKTTAPGWNKGTNGNKVGHDIEIVNGRKLKTSGEQAQVGQFSVTQDQMYKNNEHGDQFAELNCENVGALYQDILTTPNSQCYWDLDYAGRWNQNSMYVVAMSAQDAQKYTTAKQIKTYITDNTTVQNITTNQEGSMGTEVTMEEGVTARIWKVTSEKNAGVWNSHYGIYSVPSGDKNYLTRFFFVSAGGAKKTESSEPEATVGSLLDNITFVQRQPYTIEYYIDNKIQDSLTTRGLVTPYDRVSIPNPTEVQKVTLYAAKVSGDGNANTQDFYLDKSDRNLTVAYNHNILRLYYKSGVVAATIKVEGMSQIPNDYRIDVNLKDKDGNVVKTETLYQSNFSKIETDNSNDPVSYFNTVTFEGSGLTNGDTYTIEEVIVKNNYLPDYLNNVNNNGTNEDVGAGKVGEENLTYTARFTYNSETGNTLQFVNIYKPVRQVTIRKKVSGNMAEINKAFNFTLNITKDGAATDAVEVPNSGIITKTKTGEYTFSLKNSNSITVTVYNGCNVTVTEDDYSKRSGVDTDKYSDDYYKTSWSVNGADNGSGRTVEIKKIAADVNLVCNNVYNDRGDVEVQGFQMNGNKDKGGVSEFSPSFRVVCRVSKSTIMGTKVKKFGIIYAIKGEAAGKTSEQLKSMMVINPNNTNENIKVHEESKTGVYQEWSTKEDSEYSSKYWNYYAVTFKCLNYMFPTLEENITIRAYAEMADGSIEYGQNVYTVNMYQIAEHLYQNQKMSTLKGHEFIYNDVLNLVTMKKNRPSIAKAMMKVLEVTSSESKYYTVLNKVYKDMNDFIYCQNGYKDKYSERTEFVPISLEETELRALVKALNEKRGTNYSDLNEWIYNETEKIGNYLGYYRKVQYEWNNGIYIRK